MDKGFYEQTNQQRLTAASTHLQEMEAIPVLVLGVKVDTKQLLILGFTDQTGDPEMLKMMLQDFLNAANEHQGISFRKVL